MKDFDWIMKGILPLLAAAFIAWFIPDGILSVYSKFDPKASPTDLNIKIFGFCITYLITLGIEFSRDFKGEISSLKKDLPELLSHKVQTSVENSILRVMWSNLQNDAESTKIIHKIIKRFIRPMVDIPSHLLDAYLVVIETSINNFSRDIRKLGKEGYGVNLKTHLGTTERLAKKSEMYVQIQRRVFDIDTEWSKDWKLLVERLGQPDQIDCRYIVVMKEHAFKNEKDKIQKMRRFFTKNNFSFQYCDDDQMLNALGTDYSPPPEHVVEVFDNDIVKLQCIPKHGYNALDSKNPPTINITIIEKDKRDDVHEFINYVLQNSKEVPADFC